MFSDLPPQEQRVEKIKPLLKKLGIQVVPDYTGYEDEQTILQQEKTANKNRAKKIEDLKKSINKIPQEDKEKFNQLTALTNELETNIAHLWDKENALTQEKYKEIHLYQQDPEIADLLKEKEAAKENKVQFDALQKQYLNKQDEYLKKRYNEKRKESPSDSTYYIEIAKTQDDRKTQETKHTDTRKELDAMKITKLKKELDTQETYLAKYKQQLGSKENNAAAVESLAETRKKNIVETFKPRCELNQAVADRIRKKIGVASNKQSHYIDCAIAYCIGQLEQLNPAAQEALRKQCIAADWSLDKNGELIYKKGKKLAPTTMSFISDMTYQDYVEVANEKIREKQAKKYKADNNLAQKEPDIKPRFMQSHSILLGFTAVKKQKTSAVIITTPDPAENIEPVAGSTAPQATIPLPSPHPDAKFQSFCETIVDNYKKEIKVAAKIDAIPEAVLAYQPAEKKMQVTTAPSWPTWDIKKTSSGDCEIMVPEDDDTKAAEHIIRSAIKAAVNAYPSHPLSIDLQDPKQINFAITEITDHYPTFKYSLTPDSQKILEEANAKKEETGMTATANKGIHPL